MLIAVSSIDPTMSGRPFLEHELREAKSAVPQADDAYGDRLADAYGRGMALMTALMRRPGCSATSMIPMTYGGSRPGTGASFSAAADQIQRVLRTALQLLEDRLLARPRSPLRVKPATQLGAIRSEMSQHRLLILFDRTSFYPVRVQFLNPHVKV